MQPAERLLSGECFIVRTDLFFLSLVYYGHTKALDLVVYTRTGHWPLSWPVISTEQSKGQMQSVEIPLYQTGKLSAAAFQIAAAQDQQSSSKDDLSHVQYARSTFPLLAAGCAPHLAYLSSLSLDGRAYSGLGWRIFSSPCFHPSGAPTIGHSIGIFVVLDTDVSTQCHTLCYYSLSSIQYLASSIL